MQRALQNIEVVVGYTEELAAAELPIAEGAGLIYPAPDALSLGTVAATQPPEQLVMLDGTWHHTKTLVRDVSALQALPKYCLTPRNPGRFRIRREPTKHAMSTVEAAAMALQAIEPNTAGLADLLTAFDALVQGQLDHPQTRSNWRARKRRFNARPQLPASMQRLENIVIAYGEAEPRTRDLPDNDRLPICWMAERLGNSETFCQFIQPRAPLDAGFLDNLSLDRRHFEHAMTIDRFEERWRRFIRPTDSIVVYNHGTAKLIQRAWEPAPITVLKHVCANLDQRTYSNLAALLQAKQVRRLTSPLPGRAGRRLADTKALTLYLLAHT